ncbi:MAG TPA: alpha/beta fold hydrolase [Labilithrix sp.]|jgi:homoserine O-acetyltransferase|nr:alpha/beta fold hydrolase [Labilithrix sp.]
MEFPHEGQPSDAPEIGRKTTGGIRSVLRAATMMRARVCLGLFAGLAIACSPPPPVRSAAEGAGAAIGSRSAAPGAESEQRIATLGTCTLESGEKIDDCRVGYRTFGKLDASKSNVVLFPTWFSGDTKALTEIVPDKIVDTKRFFLVLVDALGNGVSSAPSSSRSQSRLRFPKFTIHDMVESQRRLLREVLGVEKVFAVVGISMGGMQAYEWAVSHPAEVDRIVPIVGTPQLTTTDRLLWTTELHLLQGSKAYADGEYRGRPKIPALRELHWLMLTTPAHRNAETTRSAFPSWVATAGSDIAFDWNDWHRQLEAMLSHDVARADGGDLALAAKRVKAKGLVVVAEHDQMVNPEPSKAFAKAMNASLVVLDGPCGHMIPSCDPSVAGRVKAFLEE